MDDHNDVHPLQGPRATRDRGLQRKRHILCAEVNPRLEMFIVIREAIFWELILQGSDSW